MAEAKRRKCLARIDRLEQQLARERDALKTCDVEAPPPVALPHVVAEIKTRTPISLGHLGNVLRSTFPGFHVSQYGHASLKALIAGQPGIQVYQNENGADFVKHT